MTLSDVFVGAGSVTGRAHRLALRDGQDGAATVSAPGVAAAIVTDGCSSGRTSEVGARLGAAWLSALVGAHLGGAADEEGACAAAAAIGDGLVRRLRALDLSSEAAEQMLLFGFLVAAVTERVAIVFGVGDGLAWIDGRLVVVDPGPANAPPYVAYALFGRAPAVSVHFVGHADALAVATDGVDEATLDALARDPGLERNPACLRRQLVVLSDAGRFSDDATVGVVRRSRAQR